MVRKLNAAGKPPKNRTRRGVHPAVTLPMTATTALQRGSVAALLVIAAVVVYWNSLDCGFVNWDDRPYVRENPLVTGDGGLPAIWLDVFREKPAKQYYPLVWTSFWIERRFFGESIRALHATQMALHAATGVTIFFTLLWLGAPFVAAFAAALLFVVHPVNVASVTWIAERKNTLSALFFWLSLMLYLQNRRGRGPGKWRYVASLAMYLAALFSKTACVVLAPVLLVTDRVLDGRWTRRALLRAVPFFALGIFMGRVTAYVEALQRKSGEAVDLAMRPFVAAAAVVHYFYKTIAPIELVPIYPRWPESLTAPRYWLSIAALAAAALLGWRFRRRISPLAAWSTAFFLITLVPVLGLVQFNLLQFTFVSDHFLYLPCIGILLPVGLGLNRLTRGAGAATVAGQRPTMGVWPAVCVTALLAVTLGWLTIRQNRVWRSPVTFWEFTIERNPDCFPAHYNLGNYYFRENDFARALPYYQAASELDPAMIATQRSAARCLRRLDRAEEALERYRRAAENEARKSRTSVGVRAEYAAYLRSLGRPQAALVEYEEVLKRQPNHAQARRAVEAIRGTGGGT